MTLPSEVIPALVLALFALPPLPESEAALPSLDFKSEGGAALGAALVLAALVALGEGAELAGALGAGLLASQAACRSLPSMPASGTGTPDAPLKIEATPMPESSSMPSASPANFNATGAQTLP
jgi:hypothetical protein